MPPVSSGVSSVPLSSRASTASAWAWVRAILSWARCIIIAASLVCSPIPASVSPAVLVALAASYEALSDSRWVANDWTLAWYFWSASCSFSTWALEGRDLGVEGLALLR